MSFNLGQMQRWTELKKENTFFLSSQKSKKLVTKKERKSEKSEKGRDKESVEG